MTTTTTSISLGLNGGTAGATLSGGGAINAVNGVATFSGLSVNKVGTGYSLTATSSLGNATSSTFDVSAGAANKIVFGQQPTSTTAGTAINPAVTVLVLDANDNPVNANTSISLSLTGGTSGASLMGGGAINAVNGVVTFSGLSVNKVGSSYGLTATSSLGNATSSNFDITPAGADHLTITSQPGDATAGDPSIGLTVEVRDANDNLVTASSDQVTLTLNPAVPGVLSGQSQVNAQNGVATFSNLSVDKVGTYSLSAAASGMLSATSDTFNIGAGAPAAVVFTQQPTDTHDGDVINGTTGVKVHVTDANGNDVEPTNVDMAFAADPTGVATLNGGSSVTVQTGGGGVATFFLVIAPTSSDYQLQATAGSITTLSDTFRITSSAATGCTASDCTQSLDNNSTVTAPPGTTLIVETNQLECSGVTHPIAGTVTIIPDPNAGTITVMFDDEIGFPILGPYPFCKAPNVTETIPFCDSISDGLDKPAGTKACLEQSIEFSGANPNPKLHTVLYMDSNDPPVRH